MTTSSLLSSLISVVAPQLAATAGSSTPSSGTASPGSDAQFKAQFGQAVSALAALANAPASASGSSASATAGSATTAGATSTAPAVTAQLTTDLQKKIDDLLAGGATLQQIVGQLAAALANTFAAHFGGDTAAIQTQLQTVFASALSPPGNGPPSSTADLASTLAQRFRQIADIAAGVADETGQSNRIFAGSFSDAAATAGGQPAPTQPNLTASQSDGATVASAAPAVGSNGDTLLGRILTRAANVSAQRAASSPAPSPATTAAAFAAALGEGANAKAASADALVNRTIAAATALLGQAGATPNAPTAPATGPVPATAANASADPVTALTNAASTALAPASATTSATTPGAAPLSSAVTAFVTSFTDALAATSGNAPSTTDKASTTDGTALPTTVASSQAPTIGAFAPIAQAQLIDGSSANPASTPATQAQPAADQSAIIEQVLRGAFLTTTGDASTVRLKLVPESLGDVSVKLDINGSSVSASVIAQTPAAHDALVAGQAQLTRALSDAGLKLSSFNVSLAGGFTSFQQQQQQSSGHRQSAFTAGRTLLGDVDSSETEDPSLLAIPSFAPSTTTISGWGAYNYLV